MPEHAATTTIESKTNFIGAAKEGSVVEAEAVPLHAGRRTPVWQTSVRREDGKLVAVVIQTQMVICGMDRRSRNAGPAGQRNGRAADQNLARMPKPTVVPSSMLIE